MIDSLEVQKTAELAKLEIPSDKVSAVGAQFANILKDFSTLQKVDTEGVEPMVSPLEHLDVLREDQVQNMVSVEEMMTNAPESQGSLFRVPPVV